MRRGRAALLLATVFGASLVACNLIAGFASEYQVGGTTPPGDEGGGPDGSNPESSTTDTQPPTDGPQTDSGLDAPVDANFCVPNEAGAVYFCDDFEGAFDAGKPAGWDFVQVQAPSTISIAAAEGINGSKALKVTLTQSGQLSRTNWVRKLLGALVPHYEAEFYIRAPATPTSTLFYGVLADVAFPGTTQGSQEDHGLSVGNNGTTFRGIGGVGTPVNDGLHVWHRVRIQLDATSGTVYTRRLFIDEVKSEESSNHDLAGTTGPEMRLGIFFTPDGANATQTIYFDNIVIRE